MRAYTKISDAPLGDRSASRKAQIVVYLDETLFAEGWESELAEGGFVLLNTTRPPDDPRIRALDADGISSEVLGRSIPNTAFLGAIAAISEAVSLEDIHEGIRATMPERLQEKNIRIADAAYEALAASLETLPEEPSAKPHSLGASLRADEPAPSRSPKPEAARPRTTHTPALRASFTPPADFACTTCFTAGHLVSENAGWRSAFPVIDAERCTRCLQCYLACPDGTIFKVRDASGEVEHLAIDYAFCKGCGICAQVCPAECVAFIPEGAEEGASA